MEIVFSLKSAGVLGLLPFEEGYFLACGRIR